MIDTLKVEEVEPKVVAVIVTFNRKNLLLRALESVHRQTSATTHVIVIDNASTDGTPGALMNAGYLAPSDITLLDSDPAKPQMVIEKSRLSYVRLSSNVGGAGGFHQGQRFAIEKAADWIWMMDDDGYADPECLEILLKITNTYKCDAVNPIVIDCDDKEQLAFGLSQTKQVGALKKKFHTQEIVESEANFFNGTLISAEAVNDVGFIKREMFIWGDEKEYFSRLERAQKKVATVLTARFYHPSSKSFYDTALFGLLKVENKPWPLAMNLIRNVGFLNRTYGNFLSHKYIIKVVILRLLRFELKEAFLSCKYYIDGYIDQFKLPSIRR
jgi:GT2 family glycosyltransferase